ncbi:MAG: hypothetical protein IJ690_05835 [Clostridia bacterium]|nr:hypothetical protein [Clostridia bacterium]
MKHTHHRRLLSVILFPIYVILFFSTLFLIEILLILVGAISIFVLPLIGAYYALSMKKDNYIEDIQDDDHRT